MKKSIVILSMFFGQYIFAQKLNTDVTIIDVTKYVMEMFPKHDNNMSGNISHYRYDAVSHPVLHIIEEKDIILVTLLKYDANGNLVQRIFSVWILDSSKKYWETKLPTKDASKFRVLYSEAVELILESSTSKPKTNYQRTKLPKGAFSFYEYLQYT